MDNLQEYDSLWKVVLWGLGTCVTGFLFLAGWLWWIVEKLNNKASYSWIESQVQLSINNKISIMQLTLNEIKEAIIGNFEKRGLIHKQDDIEREIKMMKENCQKTHSR